MKSFDNKNMSCSITSTFDMPKGDILSIRSQNPDVFYKILDKNMSCTYIDCLNN